MSYGVIGMNNVNINNTLKSLGPGGTACMDGTGTFENANTDMETGINEYKPASKPRYAKEVFIEHTIPGLPAGEIPVCAFIPLTTECTTPSQYDDQYGYYNGAKPELNVEGWINDWGGGAVSYQKWVKPADMATGGLAWLSADANRRTKADNFGGGRGLRDLLATAGTVRVLAAMSSHRQKIWPNNDDYNAGYDRAFFKLSYTSNSYTGGDLIYGSAISTSLTYVSSCSIQLSDGSIAFLSIDSGTVQLRRTKNYGATSDLIATIDTVTNANVPGSGSSSANYKFNIINGLKSFDLICDDSDNIYVIGTSTNGDNARSAAGYYYFNRFAIQAFIRASLDSETWSARPIWATDTNYSTATFAYDLNSRASGDLNNISAVYHNIGSGVITLCGSHTNGSGQDNQLSFYNVLANRVRASNKSQWATDTIKYINVDNQWLGAGMLSKTGGSGTDLSYPCNDTGTGLDHITRGAAGSGLGTIATYISSTNRAGVRPMASAVRNVGLIKYQVGSDGKFSSTPSAVSISSNPIPMSPMRDANAKIRLLELDNSRYALITAGGIAVFTSAHALQYTATNTNDGISPLLGLPYDPGANKDDRTLHFNHNWDAVFDPVSRQIVIYSIDCSTTPNWRNIVASHWSTLASSTAPVSSRTVASLTGNSGSRTRAIRVPRKARDVGKITIHLGNVTVDRVYSTIAISDSGVNTAPNAPVLAAISTFQANKAKDFNWTFSDPNGHLQTAYQVQIRRKSDSVSVYDSGKVSDNTSKITIAANTLANNNTYQWRARVYDTYDLDSVWSAWTDFSTTSAPIVTIIDPPADYQSTDSSVIKVEWTVEPNTQAKYQILVKRASDNVTLSDTGLITEATTRSRNITGFVSDIDQIIQVYVTDSSGTVTPPGLRTVRPSYARPQKPIATLTPMGIFIRIEIVNPTPGTDQDQIIRNDVFRRRTGGTDADWVRIAQVGLNGTYDDYAVGSGRSYDYRVDGVS